MTTVGLIFGGRSAEHEISLISARNILEAIDKDRFDVKLIGITHEGKWYYCETHEWLPKTATGNPPKIENYGKPIALIPGPQKNKLVLLEQDQQGISLDIIFPITHGTYGEDGKLQGLIEHLNLPYIGPDTLSSAINMDKDIMKRLLKTAGIPIGKYLVFHKDELIEAKKVLNVLKTPIFVKPSNSGSSVGISKVTDEDQLEKAIKHAFQFDNKIIVEEGIMGREIECAVLGNSEPQASPIGEIIVPNNFYSYSAKYLDEKGIELHAPADLTEEESNYAKSLAIEAYKTLCCEGMARVDMFLTDHGKLYINELNTLPGFTKISMYPKLWQKNGMSYTELITNLIELAQNRFSQKNTLKINV